LAYATARVITHLVGGAIDTALSLLKRVALVARARLKRSQVGA
jgi:hypothetical protein